MSNPSPSSSPPPPSSSSSNSTLTSNKGKGKDLRLPKFTPVTSSQLDQEQPTSGSTTPNIAETASQIRRSLSVSGLSELAHLPPGQLRKNVGKKIWRPQDEEARIPGDWERLMVHVVRAGIRAGTLAFGLRATVSLVFALLKGLRTKKLKGRDVVQAIFGPVILRFAAMFAIWATLYKATHNSLRLLTSTPQHRSSRSQSDPRGSSVDLEKFQSQHASSDDNEPASGATTPRAIADLSEEEKAQHKADTKRKIFMGDPRSRVWHAYVAGAVSALAILVERKQDRISLAQQLFVRGLEGTYNVAHSRGQINIPHGAVLTFGLACGQIMYAWLNAPESLPRGYLSWITKASQVSPPVVNIHRSIVLDKAPKASDALQYFTDGKVPIPSSSGRYPNVAPNAINRRGITSQNVAKIVKWMEETDEGKVGFYAPHSMTHPWENSHYWSPLDRFIEVTRWILPVYMTLHFVPAIFLRMGSFLKSPLRVFLRSLFGSVRSSSFLGLFVTIFQTWYCLLHSTHDRILSSNTLSAVFPDWFKNLLVSRGTHWLGGFLTSLALFVEHPRRRAELAAYVLPKGMESAWSVARKRSWVPFVPGGDLLLTSFGMSLVMGTYAQSPEHLSGLVRRIVYQFVGRN